jgi:hypothetical protein
MNLPRTIFSGNVFSDDVFRSRSLHEYTDTKQETETLLEQFS